MSRKIPPFHLEDSRIIPTFATCYGTSYTIRYRKYTNLPVIGKAFYDLFTSRFIGIQLDAVGISR